MTVSHIEFLLQDISMKIVDPSIPRAATHVLIASYSYCCF